MPSSLWAKDCPRSDFQKLTSVRSSFQNILWQYLTSVAHQQVSGSCKPHSLGRIFILQLVHCIFPEIEILCECQTPRMQNRFHYSRWPSWAHGLTFEWKCHHLLQMDSFSLQTHWLNPPASPVMVQLWVSVIVDSMKSMLNTTPANKTRESVFQRFLFLYCLPPPRTPMWV